ncbi:hypothetical protein JIX56_21665 [Streptomyces sp. CA-210063]|uniref:hypothetical protein n=1 Tax=Streptomyces sp. CA-210063 TaxID=2801029 RepID=UPI00214C3EF3|nr:hypothetical protein [Streptomyces sp. CA-210063]UUU32303.1 hypothetical protein JIX56_21665 [Streptomyces sp. CA-210063]
MVITVQSDSRSKKALVFGISLAVVVMAAVGIGGAYWWQQRDAPSQASAADCALAQKIIDEAQELPADEAAVAKWRKDTRDLRIAEMKDGYLGLRIATYEQWAADHATGTAEAPTKQELADMTKTANSHCTEAERTLVVPPIAS